MEIEEFEELILSGYKTDNDKALAYLYIELYKFLLNANCNKKETAENSRSLTLQEIISMLGLPTDDTPQSDE